jgi:glycerol-3-phosphate dehydrogenase (NAD(P)+)
LKERVAIIGATTWGTTLGIILARNNAPVSILACTPAEAAELDSQRRNKRFLPNVPFPDALEVASKAQETLTAADLVIIAVPSHRLRENIRCIRHYLSPGVTILSAAKGLELPQGRRMSQVLQEELPPRFHAGICALSGPNLAQEVVEGKFSSTVVAGADSSKTQRVQAALMSRSFRVYTSSDVIGVELGGALKNIIGLGAGIADGMGVGANSKSAFITRGLAEITRLGIAAGAQALTFAGLAGLGDLIATCTSPLSRNRYVGEQLAQGSTWAEIQRSMDNVAEGVNTTAAALAMASRLGVEMPIAQVTHRVLFDGLSPKEAAAQLMERPARSEW